MGELLNEKILILAANPGQELDRRRKIYTLKSVIERSQESKLIPTTLYNKVKSNVKTKNPDSIR